jgi:flavin reductase (DIM6/NTAB) family NADH-FMN oxidoreductase RutF
MHQTVDPAILYLQLTATESQAVAPTRVHECPVQLEAVVDEVRSLGTKDARFAGVRAPLAVEVRIVRVHVEESLLADGLPNRIDPTKRRALIMSFRRFFGLGEVLHPSCLSEFPERAFRPRERRRA